MEEAWQDIPDYPGYRISNLGRVWSAKTNRILRLGTMQKGYRHVVLCKENQPKTYRLNRLMLTVFLGPAFVGAQAAHRNGDKSDNRLANLYWATVAENVQDRINHGGYRSGFDHVMAKLSIGDLRYAKWQRSLKASWEEIAKDVGVTADTISRRTRQAVAEGTI